MAKLKEVVDGVLNDESTLASEERFLKLRAVIEMLKITDETPERIYRLRLDTRKHVTFLGVEHNADGTRGAVYDSAQGLSGGQHRSWSSSALPLPCDINSLVLG